MAVLVHYCDKCGIRIEPEDIKDGKALLTEEGNAFCPKCNKQGEQQKAKIPAIKSKPISQRKRTTRVGPPKRKTTTTIMRPQKRKGRLDEYEEEDEKAPVSYTAKKSSLPLVLGICGVAVVLIIIIIAASGSGDGKVDSKVTDKDPYDESSRYPLDNKPDNRPPPNDTAMNDRTDPIDTDSVYQARAGEATKRYEEALAHGRSNPKDYAGVLDKLESIMRTENVSPSLADRIQLSIADWMGKWDSAASGDWDQTTERAQKLVASEDYKGAAKLWEKFSEKFKKHASYAEQGTAEAKRLQKIQQAITEMKTVEDDVKLAGKGFTVEELDKAREVLERICVFGRKYKDVELIVQKLGPVVIKLREEIDKLEDEAWARELEGFDK